MRAIQDTEDDEARSAMLLAAAYAGIGFGNAGVHLPHGMSYPVSGMVREYRPAGYPSDHPIIPHGMAVILNAPAVFRFTAPTNPEKHLYAARLMGVDTAGAAAEDAGELLAGAVIDLMQQTGVPNGLGAIGFTEGGHSGPGRRHFATTQGDEALAATGGCAGSGGAFPGRDEVLVM